MSNDKQQTAVDQLFDQLSSENLLGLFTHDQMKRAMEILEQAKAMHRQEHGQTWADSIWNLQERRMNEDRAHDDFDDYYEEEYGGNKWK